MFRSPRKIPASIVASRPRAPVAALGDAAVLHVAAGGAASNPSSPSMAQTSHDSFSTTSRKSSNSPATAAIAAVTVVAAADAAVFGLVAAPTARGRHRPHDANSVAIPPSRASRVVRSVLSVKSAMKATMALPAPSRTRAKMVCRFSSLGYRTCVCVCDVYGVMYLPVVCGAWRVFACMDVNVRARRSATRSDNYV